MLLEDGTTLSLTTYLPGKIYKIIGVVRSGLWHPSLNFAIAKNFKITQFLKIQ